MGKRNPILIKLLDDTKKDIDHFLNRYAEKVISGDASLFLGSGVSRESGFPSWAALLAPCAEELGIDMGDDTDLYSIAQYYSNRHSDAELRQLFNKAINQFAEPGDVLNNLLEIPFRSIWTTNYDRLIEHGLDKQNIGYNSIVNDMDLASISRDTKISVYKMNGDISEPTKMIVTKNDYEHYSQKHPLFLTFLKKELVANTFLFVGYSFSDALVLDCLSSLTEYLGTAGGCHYAIMLVNERVTAKTQYFFEDLRKRYNIKCLAVRKEDIPSLISRLSLKVREKKVFISGAFDTVPEEINTFADSLSYELVQHLYENGFRIATGVGKRLGTFFTGYAHQYLAERNITNTSRYLSMRPFPFHLALNEDAKIRYRKIMQADCSAAIFMFGQSKSTADEGGYNATGHFSRGVYMEYELAKQSGLAIIPVGATGYEAEVIWKEVKNNINQYYYLSKKIDKLRNERDPAKLSELIISILRDIPKKNRISK